MQWTVLHLDIGASSDEGSVWEEAFKERREKEGETQLVAGPGVTWQAHRHWINEREREDIDA